jgi:hypothetical protein
MSSSLAEDFIDINDFVFDPQDSGLGAVIESGPLPNGSGSLDVEFPSNEVDPNDEIDGSKATLGVKSSLYPKNNCTTCKSCAVGTLLNGANC